MRGSRLLSILLFGFTLLVKPGIVLQQQTLLHASELPVVEVYKSATCGCCNKWIEHLKQSGFSVKAKTLSAMRAFKQSLGIAPRLTSCHTALVGGYIIEGHVPANDMKRLLKTRPHIKGLSVPGMPLGSPGMEQPDGAKENYNVLSFDEFGKTSVFSRH